MQRLRLVVIAGPTATGKTALAVELAHRLGTEVVSVDSRQVYRGLDLGTGKDLYEYSRFDPPVPYRLIDIADPNDTYSLFQYQRDCYSVLEDLTRLGQGTVVLAGGTGMYLEAVLKRYRIANVPENPTLRNALAAKSREELETGLRSGDPAVAARTDMSSRKRIVRGWEIMEAGLQAPVEYSREPELEFDIHLFALRRDRSLLRARIDARLEARLQAGMIAEVEGLLAAGVSRARMDVLGMEYREIAAHLAGEKSRETMVADLRHEIHLLAKRQETWFRGMDRRGLAVSWLDEGQGADAVLRTLERNGKE